MGWKMDPRFRIYANHVGSPANRQKQGKRSFRFASNLAGIRNFWQSCDLDHRRVKIGGLAKRYAGPSKPIETRSCQFIMVGIFFGHADPSSFRQVCILLLIVTGRMQDHGSGVVNGLSMRGEGRRFQKCPTGAPGTSPFLSDPSHLKIPSKCPRRRFGPERGRKHERSV